MPWCAALSVAAASALLPACSKVVSVGADPTTLEFPGSDFDGSGPVTRSTTICYTGPGQAEVTAEVPSPFSLVSGDGSDTGAETTDGPFSIAEGSCHELVVALAAPADLDERLTLAVVGELISGTVAVSLQATAQEGGTGDGGSTDGGGTDGGGTDGGGTDGGGTDGGGTDGGGTDGGGTDGGGTDGGDTGGGTSACPPYSGLATTRERTYEATSNYTDLYRLSGTKTLTVDASDPDAPVLVTSYEMTDSSGGTLRTTVRDGYTCTSSGSTLVWSETEGSLVGVDGTSLSIERTDTYSDGMLTMVPGFGSGGTVADTFTFERVEDGRTTTINGSNVEYGGGIATTKTAAGTYTTVQTHILYTAGSDTLNYYAYLDEELGDVSSFYWVLVSVD